MTKMTRRKFAAITMLTSGFAVAIQPVSSKLMTLKEFVSVKDFGAVGDGITDDSSAIQSAVTASNKVYIPAGTYKITKGITIPSNREIFGDGAGTIIQLAANSITAFSTGNSSDSSNIFIHNLLIDGGGQTSTISTGFRGCVGIYATRISNLKINNVVIQKMGVSNQVKPTIDSDSGGFGIIVEARYGSIQNIRISNCTINNIAGGGMNSGDGIYIAGYAKGVGLSHTDVVIRDCWVSTCGRHCYTVAGGSGETIPSGIKIINCYAEKAALDGLDIEDGYEVLIDGCTFYACGNDQTYFNPVSAYGASYRLLAGIAISNNSVNISIINSRFDRCYYGITYGATQGLLVQNCNFATSIVSDLTMGGAAGALDFRIIGCEFKSITDLLEYYQTKSACGFIATACIFYGTVKVSAMADGIFQNCNFRKGFAVTGGSGLFARNKFVGCTFTDWNGVGLQCDSDNYQSPDCIVDSCSFYGIGNLIYGISLGYFSVARWMIRNCLFSGLATAGIYQANGAGAKSFSAYNNSFVSCAAGILVKQSINDCVISGNVFNKVTGYCISISDITSAAPMRRTSVINNLIAEGCNNGIHIATSTGSFDYCVITGNNTNGASGTKWSLTTAQNKNGVTANNN
ncbi:hypothetical protein PI95_029310 [Hassallia byssoidea VB512170]|uniref:Rhamnogalacturonase A/B/Epimerase-like pectate lyase domain-containing protein n=1 Tax=Hassallia byssoidea VB512170 TaxID=1304833 RepID=A0A846HHF9_9CYAN|nr:glycosyl hydrolase family 28-related protein [Hassalia byssoidea]NEU76503.1 hypothetical protein [Hassalia byssoidea VB512170]